MKPDQRTAESEAQAATEQMLACIDNNKNFILEAGAGAGKTYSLIQALQHVIENRGAELLRHNQKVACITFTNVAKDEIRTRTDGHQVIVAETIHAFCWSILKGFQSQLRTSILEMSKWQQRIADSEEEIGHKTVKYELGYPSVNGDSISLGHDDVIALMIMFLDIPKFRNILTEQYPIILVDEYQDTSNSFVEKLEQHFLESNEGPMFGFFGDHWQKIYGDGCGTIESSSLQIIGKRANFRSDKEVVGLLNRMRPELTQETKKTANVGSIEAYHTNDWSGIRRTESHWKGDLPSDQAHDHLQRLCTSLEAKGWDMSKTKILMLTHNVLADEQGYRNLANVFSRNESFIKKEDYYIAFMVDVVEPVCDAYQNRQYGRMFSILGRSSLIRTHADKVQWAKDMDKLLELRESGTIGEVIEHLRTTKRPRIPENIQRKESRLILISDDSIEMEDEERRKLERILKLKTVNFKEVTALAKFIDERTPFSTKHSVKGAEFENVLVVLGRGWSQYDFGKMLEWMQVGIPAAKQDSFERNRNLFYVASSRPKHNLAMLFTQELSNDALTSLSSLFGDSNLKSCP